MSYCDQVHSREQTSVGKRREGGEEGRRGKREEGRGKREEGRGGEGRRV
jgi:hypothetical protein